MNMYGHTPNFIVTRNKKMMRLVITFHAFGSGITPDGYFRIFVPDVENIDTFIQGYLQSYVDSHPDITRFKKVDEEFRTIAEDFKND